MSILIGIGTGKVYFNIYDIHSTFLERSQSLSFINRRPNLLNVAVSRARELFILVGNLGRISEGGHTKELVEYIQQFGEIRYFESSANAKI